MEFAITELFNAIPDEHLSVVLGERQIAHSQDESFFHFGLEKSRRLRHLGAHFRSLGAVGGKLRVFLADGLRGLTILSPSIEVDYLAKDYFREEDLAVAQGKCDAIRNAIVIVTNNDVANWGLQQYHIFYNACTETLFIAWDWDNHHWLGVSTFLAAHSDVYVPAHPDNRYALSRYNPAITEPVTAGINQWTHRFLEMRAGDVVQQPRADAPLGGHTMHGGFTYRNRIITTLAAHYPSISFTPAGYHDRTPEDRFDEWSSYKLHWIVPVLADIPIRIFDGLVTGGIPIIPQALRFAPELRDAAPEDILHYDQQDVLAPQRLVERGLQLFDEGGEAGILRRFRYGLERHHCDLRLSVILGYAATLLGTKF